LPFSGQQCLHVIRGWASVPQIAFLGPVVPSGYSRLSIAPSICLFWASSAFRLFEAERRSLDFPFSGQQCLQVIRGWASVPRIAFFGPAAPSGYSRLSVAPSICLFRASSAFKLFRAGRRSLELSFSGQQCLQAIRGWASVPRVVLFGPAMLSRHSSLNYEPSNHPSRAGSATISSGYGCLNPRNASLDR
jgi:hypothetical protein